MKCAKCKEEFLPTTLRQRVRSALAWFRSAVPFGMCRPCVEALDEADRSAASPGPNLRFFTCPKCAAPMERTMRSRDYWTCRFCEHEMDGWYPEPASQEVQIDTAPDGTHKRGDYVVRIDATLDYQRVLVDGPNPKLESGRVHHFDSAQVREALRGDQA